jgi:hypothetical protein
MISGILNFDCICTWLKKQPRFVEKQTETCLRSSQTRRPVEKMIPAESVSVLICSTFWRRFGNFYRPSSRFSGMSKNPVKFSVSPVLPWPLTWIWLNSSSYGRPKNRVNTSTNMFKKLEIIDKY